MHVLVPPGTKPIHAGKNSEGINFCVNACGACIRTRANTGKYFGGIIFRILAKFLREFISVRIHVAPVLAPARIQEQISGEIFMYWFRASLYSSSGLLHSHIYVLNPAQWLLDRDDLQWCIIAVDRWIHKSAVFLCGDCSQPQHQRTIVDLAWFLENRRFFAGTGAFLLGS